MKKVLIIACILPLLLCVGCDGDVKDVAERMTEVADTIGEVQSVTIDAYEKNLMSKEIHDSIITGTLKASQTGKEITIILTALENSGVKDLDTDTKRKILKYLSVITAAIDPNNFSEIMNIEDNEVRLKIKTGLEAARSLIATIEIMLEVGG